MRYSTSQERVVFFLVSCLVRREHGEAGQSVSVNPPVLDDALDEELPQSEDVDVVDDGKGEEALLDQVLLVHGLLPRSVLTPRVGGQQDSHA